MARKIVLRQERMDAAVAGFAGPLAKVDFAALDSDWEAAMVQLYADLALPLSPQAREAMRAEQAADARGRPRASPRQLR